MSVVFEAPSGGLIFIFNVKQLVEILTLHTIERMLIAVFAIGSIWM
jgi:hypothetical protein